MINTASTEYFRYCTGGGDKRKLFLFTASITIWTLFRGQTFGLNFWPPIDFHIVIPTAVNITLKLCVLSTVAVVAVFIRALHSSLLVLQPMATTETFHLFAVSLTKWKSILNKWLGSNLLAGPHFHMSMLIVFHIMYSLCFVSTAATAPMVIKARKE